MALPFSALILRQVQQFEWMTKTDHHVFTAIVKAEQVSRNTFEKSRVAMAAETDHHKRTVQKSTRKMADHGLMAIVETLIAPGYNAINQYIVNEAYFRQWLRTLTPAFQREILHKRAGGQAGHPQILGGEKIPKDLLPTPEPEEKTEEKPTREPGGLPTSTPLGWDRARAEKFLKDIGCDPGSDHYEASVARLMTGEKTGEG